MSLVFHQLYYHSWQEGYGGLTLTKDEGAKVSRYIGKQEEHHRRGALSDLLERFETDEDDRSQALAMKAS